MTGDAGNVNQAVVHSGWTPAFGYVACLTGIRCDYMVGWFTGRGVAVMTANAGDINQAVIHPGR